MPGVAVSARNVMNLLNEYGLDSAPANRGRIFVIYNAINVLISGFGNELNGRSIYLLDPKIAHFYDEPFRSFSEGLLMHFPDAVDDLEEAGRCLALGRYTASVFHLMRAAESVASVVVFSFGGETKKKNGERLTLGGLWSQIDKKVAAMEDGPERDSWNKLKSFISSLNRGDRTKVAHPGRYYNQEQAEAILHITKAFLEEAEALIFD